MNFVNLTVANVLSFRVIIAFVALKHYAVTCIIEYPICAIWFVLENIYTYSLFIHLHTYKLLTINVPIKNNPYNYHIHTYY